MDVEFPPGLQEIVHAVDEGEGRIARSDWQKMEGEKRKIQELQAHANRTVDRHRSNTDRTRIESDPAKGFNK